ncbi:ATP-binding protein [Parapusillimonas sp. SGNA-6]|nr:ATP-binding protein [Parapedobacter sp. SGR-10]NGM89597.1 ATP-binding protein [Parapusillimonas sp. SGNA-6]
MVFVRRTEGLLQDWKRREDRKPLIIRGARQVGKTTMVKDFAKTYKHTILMNLEKASDSAFFEQFDEAKLLIEALFVSKGIPLGAMGDTLLFIDEIQESPKAIQQLRYFYEEFPALHVIAAGSLLEFALKEVKNFPVGRVEYLYLHPLNFPEYLSAIGRDDLLAILENIPVTKVAHPTLMDHFHRYAIIGGMPEVVRKDVQKESLPDLQRVYAGIWDTYKGDVEKYAANDNQRRIIRYILETAPLHVDERIRFQGFGNSNYRSREVGEAFRILDDARVIRLLYPTTEIDPPLRLDVKKAPRLQFLDTGLVNYSLRIQAEMLGMDDLNQAYKGAIIPHLVAQELISIENSGDVRPVFWVREKSQSQAEVDLLLSYRDKVVPVEIKSGKTGSLRSLHQFIEQSGARHAIRIYGGEFVLERTQTPNKQPYLLLNLPYYLGSTLPKYLPWLLEQ